MAYTTATIIDKSIEGSGRVCLQINYTGDSGEPAVRMPLYIDQSTSVPAGYVRGLAMDMLARLNQNRTQYQNLTLPFVLDTTTPLPVSSAFLSLPNVSGGVAVPFAPAATATDVFTISGSATKTVTVIAAGIFSTQTAQGSNFWHLVKRSAADTGGTSTTPSPFVVSNGPATAVVRQYSANPTGLGASAGFMCPPLRVPSPPPANAGLPTDGKFAADMGQIVLAQGELLAWNFNGQAIPSGMQIWPWFRWTES